MENSKEVFKYNSLVEKMKPFQEQWQKSMEDSLNPKQELLDSNTQDNKQVSSINMKHRISNNYGLKIHHISDTHAQQWFKMDIPTDTDVLIHSGDATNYHDLARNNNEWLDFIEWYASLPIPIKIYVPGNHDSTCYHENKRVRKMCKDAGIEYLNKDTFSVYGLNFYGDPMTPTFGSWFFTSDRSKIGKHWDLIPEDTDVLITHGPRKGFLDLSTTGGGLNFCGDSSLGRRIDSLPNLKLHCHGHIHSSKDVINTGVREHNGVFYSNASAVKDGEFNKGIQFHGNTFIL